MTAEENVVAPVESVAVPGAEEVPIATSTLTPTPVDESTPIVSDLQAKIIKQIEFYFHDANLARDNFLLAELKKNEDQCRCESVCTSGVCRVHLACMRSFVPMDVHDSFPPSH